MLEVIIAAHNPSTDFFRSPIISLRLCNAITTGARNIKGMSYGKHIPLQTGVQSKNSGANSLTFYQTLRYYKNGNYPSINTRVTF